MKRSLIDGVVERWRPRNPEVRGSLPSRVLPRGLSPVWTHLPRITQLSRLCCVEEATAQVVYCDSFLNPSNHSIDNAVLTSLTLLLLLLYFTLLYFTLLYFTVLHFTMLYFYFTVHYITLLYCTLLTLHYFTLLNLLYFTLLYPSSCTILGVEGRKSFLSAASLKA